MGGKRTHARHIFDGEGRLLTAYRRIVAKIPFLHVKEQQQQVEAEEEKDGDSPNLCQRCKELDLDGIFNARSPSTESKTVLSLGTLDKESTCALCRFFYSMRRPTTTGETTDLYHLRKYRLNHLLSGPGLEDSTLWAIDQDLAFGGWTPLWDREYPMISRSLDDNLRLWFLPQSSYSEYFDPMKPWPDHTTLKGLPVNETSVNYTLLRGWIKECEDHPDCKYRGLDPTKSHNRTTIRGIDCRTRLIVDLQPGDTYIALSYVWGNKALPDNKGNRALPTTTPKVIEDAMIVVKKLGQHHLWVDQYCIDQHDEQDKHAQIRNMDHIYEGSHATIVAFSGDDSSFGLPGVSSTPRIPQPRFTSSNLTLLGFTPASTRQSLDASFWMRRGWTFQEALLSRRLLIFAQEQVYFYCSLGSWVESCTPRPRMLFQFNSNSPYAYSGLDWGRSMISTIVPLRRLRHSSYGFQVNISAGKLIELIQSYSGRQLSFQADALNAFQGLLSRVSVLTYWGVPCCEIPHRNSDETYHSFALKTSNTTATSLFLRCLLWTPIRAATETEYFGRREGFPSWSWLGWRTPVVFERHGNQLDYLTFRKVKIEDASGGLLSIADLIALSGSEMERSRVLPERTTYLWLKGLVFTLGFQPGSSRHDGEICFCFNHPLGYSGYPRKVIKDCLQSMKCQVNRTPQSKMEVNFRLDVKGSKEISRRTLKRKWDCLLIFSYGAPAVHHFLILDQGDDAAYCVGTLRVWNSTRNGNLLEKLKTKVPYSWRKVRLG